MSDKPYYYYLIPNKLYLLDGTEVETVSFNKFSGSLQWKYKRSSLVYDGKLGINVFIKNPCISKEKPTSGSFIEPGCKIKLFNMLTKEMGYYILVYKRGDTHVIPPVRTTGGKYYGELTVGSTFGQELLYLYEGDYAVYYLPKGNIKYYRVEKIEPVRGLYNEM